MDLLALVRLAESTRARAGYLDDQPDDGTDVLLLEDRDDAIEHAHAVALALDVSDEALAYAINYFDRAWDSRLAERRRRWRRSSRLRVVCRILSARGLPSHCILRVVDLVVGDERRGRARRSALACLVLASKFCDVRTSTPYVADFADASRGEVREDALLHLERKIAQRLDWRMAAWPVPAFVTPLLALARRPAEEEEEEEEEGGDGIPFAVVSAPRLRALARLAARSYALMRHHPAVLAAACVAEAATQKEEEEEEEVEARGPVARLRRALAEACGVDEEVVRACGVELRRLEEEERLSRGGRC
jgi:hypothetical protein